MLHVLEIFFKQAHQLSGEAEICYQSTSSTFKRAKEGEEQWRWRPYVKFRKHYRPERYNAKSLLCNLGAATAVLLCVVESINFYATCLT